MEEPADSRTRTIDTADALRMLPYSSPLPGWHSHAASGLIPTDSCDACNEVKRRNAETAPPSEEDGAVEAEG